MRDQWEYKIVPFQVPAIGVCQTIEDVTNIYGESGWELFQVIDAPTKMLLFKRKKEI
jgi:hypothetical protein